MNFTSRKGGRSPVPYLVGQHFLLGLCSILIYTAANTLFLTKFGSGLLPWVYISMAVAMPLASFLYTEAYKRLSLLALSTWFTVAFSALYIGAWATHGAEKYRWVPFALLVGFALLNLIGNLIQGDQIQRLFNVREIKQTVPVIMAGTLCGIILSGLIVTPLVSFLGGPEELLLVSGLILPVILVLQLHTIHLFPALRQRKRLSVVTKKPLSLRKLLGTRYVRLILVYGLLSALTLRLLTFLLMASAEDAMPTPEKLSQFLGLVVSGGTLGSLLFLLFGSARLLGRFGLSFGLAGSPLAFTPILTGAALVLFFGGEGGQVYFWLILSAFTMCNVLEAGTTTIGLRTTLQALPVAERSSAETAAKGLGNSMAQGLAGVSLMAFGSGGSGSDKVVIVYVIIVCLCWISCSMYLYRDYARSLLKSLGRRALGSSNMAIEDGHTLQVIEKYLESPDAQQVRLALEVLRGAEHASYEEQLLRLVKGDKSDVKIKALELIEMDQITSADPILDEELASKGDPPVRAAALRAYCSIHEADAVERVAGFMDEAEPEIRESALVGLLRYGGISGILQAGERLIALQEEEDPQARELLAAVIGQVQDRGLYQPLLPLLTDQDPGVRRQALLAARHVRHARLIPDLVENLSSSTFRSGAMAALYEMGDELLPTLSEALAGRSYEETDVIRLLRASARTEGDPSTKLLKRHINHPDDDVQIQVLRSLSSYDYSASTDEVGDIQSTLAGELEHGMRVLQAQRGIGEHPSLAPMHRALEYEFDQMRERVFLLLSFLYEPRPILRAAERLMYGNGNEQAHALETLDVTLAGDQKAMVFPFINTSEDLTRRLTKLERIFPAQEKDRNTHLREIIANPEQYWTHEWTRVCAIYAAARLDLAEMAEVIEPCLSESNPELQETAGWALEVLKARTYSDPRHSDESARQTRTLDGGHESMLLTIEKVNILSGTEIFSETAGFVLTSVAAIAEEIEIEEGQTFVHKDAVETDMFVIVEGQVRVHIDDQTLAHLGPGEVVGETEIFDPSPRWASVTASESTMLLKIDKQAFLEAMADRPEIAQGALRVLARRLRVAHVQGQQAGATPQGA